MDISISPSGGFYLTLPSGRKLDIPNTPHASGFIYKILYDANHADQRVTPKGYIGQFPTQSVIDTWIKRDNEGKEERRQAAAAAARAEMEAQLGVPLDSIVINI